VGEFIELGMGKGFAETCKILFDFLMNGNATQNRVEFLQLQAFGGVLFVFGGDVAASAGHARVFVLGALHNHLHAVSFFSHDALRMLEMINQKRGLNVAALYKLVQGGRDAVFADGAQSVCTHAQRDPLSRFGDVEFLILQIRVKTAAGFPIGVGNIVSGDYLLAGEVANAGHER